MEESDAVEPVAKSAGSGIEMQVGLADIQSTLDQLEEQIAAYRRMLAEQEATVEEPTETGAQETQLVGIDDEELGSVAASIASDYAAFFTGLGAVADAALDETEDVEDAGDEVGQALVADDADEDDAFVAVAERVSVVEEMDVAVALEEEEVGLAAPSVEMPELFAELDRQMEMGLHRNALVAVFEDGQEHLDYLSSVDGSGVTPEPQPMFRAFSCGKAMTAAVIWRLLDAGILGIDAPVVEYWPEFAQRGKSKVTIRHVLTHTAGLPHDFGRGDVDWGDWGRMMDILASMDLEYEPGEVIHYHSITFGLLVAEIASRATGVEFEELFGREVKSPLGLTDTCFSIGADDADARNRVQKLYTAEDYFDLEMPSKMDWLMDNQIVTPGGSCITTARDLGRLYAAVCNGGVGGDGEVWLSEGAAASVYETHASAYNITEMTKNRVGQGVWMYDEQPNRMATLSATSVFGHGGMGTSIAWGDPEYGVSAAILTDTMLQEGLNGARLNRISAAIRWDLGLPVGSVGEI